MPPWAASPNCEHMIVNRVGNGDGSARTRGTARSVDLGFGTAHFPYRSFVHWRFSEVVPSARRSLMNPGVRKPVQSSKESDEFRTLGVSRIRRDAA